MKKQIFSIVAIIFIMCSASFAAPLLQNGNLQDFINLGAGGGQIDDKLFSNFSYSVTGTVSPSAAGVTVNVISTPFNPGLTFTGPWSGDGSFQIAFDIDVLLGGTPIIGFSSSFDNGTVNNIPISPPAPHLTVSISDSDVAENPLTSVTVQFQEAPVPEPATMLLLGSGLIALAGYGRKRLFWK